MAPRAGFFGRVRKQINRGDSWLTYDLANLVPGQGLDDDALEELEDRLLLADVGVEATTAVVDHLRAEANAGRIKNAKQLEAQIIGALRRILEPCAIPLDVPEFIKPYIILMVGVNGAGKTTTIGKLAKRFQSEGKSVVLAAGDTFRAAAVNQLKTWGERNNVPVIAQGQDSDSASVIFDAVQAAKARGIDVVIADTAGRLHTQGHLMDELAKIKRVVQKHDPYAPHEVMLVVDATAGGNALAQAVQFHEKVALTGLTVTKLDGTARGGIIFAIAKRLGMPIRFIGVGEQIDDLGVFDADQFIRAIFERAGGEN